MPQTLLTNEMRKRVRALAQPKGRDEQNAFVAEGSKCVRDLLGYFDCRLLLCTPAWAEENAGCQAKAREYAVCRSADLERVSNLKSTPPVIAVFEKRDTVPDINALRGNITLALDTVQDPGNLGTIIRVADWMGVHDIICSIDTVDAYNPKVVQATMGSLSRVRIHYTDLAHELKHLKDNGFAIWGTVLDKEAASVYAAVPGKDTVLVMGNEGKGISRSICGLLDKKIFIPPYPADSVTAESLNVAVATAITLAEMRRPRQ